MRFALVASGGRTRVTFAAAALFLFDCGSRTGLDDAPTIGDAAPPGDASADARDASACMSAPPGGVAIGSFPDGVVSMAVAVAGSTVYAGTAAIGLASPLFTGALVSVPASGGATQPIAASEYNYGNITSDGSRLYYPQSHGAPDGPNGSIYQVLGLASVDLATGAVHPIATAVPPRSTSSNLNSNMIAATPAWPGVFWVGATAGADGASTLASWSAQSDAVTTVATGQSLSGLAVDADGVYWADVGGGQGITVYTSPLAGGQPSVLANVTGGTYGQLLGVSATDVVFVSDYATGAISVPRLRRVQRLRRLDGAHAGVRRAEVASRAPSRRRSRQELPHSERYARGTAIALRAAQ